MDSSKTNKDIKYHSDKLDVLDFAKNNSVKNSLRKKEILKIKLSIASNTLLSFNKKADFKLPTRALHQRHGFDTDLLMQTHFENKKSSNLIQKWSRKDLYTQRKAYTSPEKTEKSL